MIDSGHQVNVISIYPTDAEKTQETYKQYNLQLITHLEKKSAIKSIASYYSYIKDGLHCLFSHPTVVFNLLVDTRIKSKHTLLSAIRQKYFYRNADIIHAHYGQTGKRLIDLKAIGLIAPSTPIVCSFHGHDIDSPAFYKNHKYYRLFFKNVDLICSNSEYLKKKLIETHCTESKIKVLKIGVDTNTFRPIKFVGETSLFSIITVARLVEIKGIAYAIKAIKILVNKGILNIRYEIFGDGHLQESLQKLIDELALNHFVRLNGSKTQKELVPHYQKSQTFILSSIVSDEGRAEAQGIVIQEAQAMELPVIVSNVGGIAEGIIPNITGFLVPEKSPAAIAEKIEYLMLNPEIAVEMGKKGRTFVKQDFNLAVKNNELIDLYEALIRKIGRHQRAE